MMIVGLISGLRDFTKSRKYFIVASVPLDDSIHAIGTPVE